MVEISTYRKNKINLEDYDYRKDIANRLLMANFSDRDLAIIEEILYSPLKTPVAKIAENLEMTAPQLVKHLEKLKKTGLFEIHGDLIIVNKDVRKYFEAQIEKFQEDFIPDMDFLQSLLKKVPIHVLPNWYPIPRTSSNIFDSLLEKYLQTPQTFQRYLGELNFTDELLSHIIRDVFSAENYKLPSTYIQKKHKLSQEAFEEIMLQLEFNFVCCIVYEKEGSEWKEVVTPFYEWREHLQFLKQTEPKELPSGAKVLRFRPRDFSFIEDLSSLLAFAKTAPITLRLSNEMWVPEKGLLKKISTALDTSFETEEECAYLARLIHKALFLKLARVENSRLIVEKDSADWLSLPVEKRALSAYKHTAHHSELSTERTVREIEKSVVRILDKGWIYYDDFLNSVIAPISEESRIVLKKKGRSWQYTQPKYSDEEKLLIKTITYDWMFEAGLVVIGSCKNRPCIAATSFGKSLFG